METAREKVGRLARKRVVASQYRAYATLVAEHERLRRTRWLGRLRASWEPEPAAWHTLRFLASVHDEAGRGTKTLLEFFGGIAASEAAPARGEQLDYGRRAPARRSASDISDGGSNGYGWSRVPGGGDSKLFTPCVAR